MSLCGATEKLVELTQSIGSANDIIDRLIDKIPITPAQGQAITDAAAIVAMASDAAAIQSLVTSKLKEYIPEIEIPEEIKGLQTDIQSFASDILTAKLAVDDITNEVSNLKTKYSGLDLGNIDINDIPKLLKDGALDLNNLCQKIPNFEEDGAGFVLKGTPISTPKSSPIADLLGIQIPIVEEFVYRIDAVKKAKDAATNFVDVQLPDTIGI
tara:strand:- start:209 stop:844 length:636 start_codon:yes stop_codon:yes gene_type:complete